MALPMIIIIVLGLIFVLQGAGMHARVLDEETKFHELQTSYFINSKAVRDSAESYSALNQDLVQIQNYPSELLRLKLVGVGKILTGIFIILFGILLVLMSMPRHLSRIIKQANQMHEPNKH